MNQINEARNRLDFRGNITRTLRAPLLAALLAACSAIPYDAGTRANECLRPQGRKDCPKTQAQNLPPPSPTLATEEIAWDELPHGASSPHGRVFVGISLSGGGSRAANFAAAVLLELDRHGLLEHAAAISSVSGGSLTNAYYGLYGGRAGSGGERRWDATDPRTVKETLRRDFQNEWIGRWLIPSNIVRYWLTPFDRSDIMKGVFDDLLFGGVPRFSDLAPRRPGPGGTGLPKILINASELNGRNFTFTDESFQAIESRLDNYPVSHAIMASAAFPGAFNNVTLGDYSARPRTEELLTPEELANPIGYYRRQPKKFYKHLLDGGPSDNLGVRALDRILRRLDRQDRPLKGCLLIVVDAYPDTAGADREAAYLQDQRAEKDARAFLDFIVDDNINNAFDDLLSNHRETMLRMLGYRAEAVADRSFWEFHAFEGNANRRSACHIWHLTFQRLAKLKRDDLAVRVNAIKTAFRLDSRYEHDAQRLQNDLFEAASVLVNQDCEGDQCVIERVKALLKEWGLPVSRVDFLQPAGQ